MKTLIMVVAMGLLAGCSLFRGDEPRVTVDNAVVTVAQGRDLKSAVVQAAVRRRWNVQEMENGDIRCQIVQRKNKVTIDIVIKSENTYAIRFVESNIPNRKYNQWINNLQREIAKMAVS